MINEQLLKQIQRFNPTNIEEIKNAIKEVMQDIILCGLAKGGFFNKCSFYGGTSLRIFHGLPRFSEDLDFSLDAKDCSFSISKYINYAISELKRFDIDSEFKLKDKTNQTSVITCYISSNLRSILLKTYEQYANQVNHNEMIRIKIEVETDFVLKSKKEYNLLVSPSFSQIKTYDMPTLFGSKLLAILTRKWSNRVKGRDYYDYLFYIANLTSINMDYLKEGLIKRNIIDVDEGFNINTLKQMLKNTFESIDIDNARKDVMPFVNKNDNIISGFNKDTLLKTIELLK